MTGIHVVDVGDGLYIVFSTIAKEEVQIDCGSQQGGKIAFKALSKLRGPRASLYPGVFILSHFHIDHYNGLVFASIDQNSGFRFGIREVYYPRIPEFAEKEEFACKLWTMNLIVFGSETGVMEYDFLQTLSKLNNRDFTFKPVTKGDIINIDGSFFEVLWPPSVLDKTIQSVVKRAVEDFEIAMEEDAEIKVLYTYVKEEGLFRKYFKEDEIDIRSTNNRRNVGALYEKRKLSAAVKKANKSLREAANHLSLAMLEDNRFLFLGDTENTDINQIVYDLMSRGRRRFHILITPHHGTHWHKSLKQISCVYSVSSNGSKLQSKMSPNFKDISWRSYATSVNGDIVLRSSQFSRRPLWPFYEGV